MKTTFEQRCKQLELEQIEQEVAFETRLQKGTWRKGKGLSLKKFSKNLISLFKKNRPKSKQSKTTLPNSSFSWRKLLKLSKLTEARLEEDEKVLQTRIAELHKKQEEIDTRVKAQLEQDHKLRKRAVFEEFEKKVCEYEEELDRKLEEE